MTTVSQNENSLQNFANVLDGLKLHQTAKALRYELEKTSQINQFESKLSKNPIINNLIEKLSTKEKKQKQNVSKVIEKTKLFQSLYDNFDNVVPLNEQLEKEKKDNRRTNAPASAKGLLSINTNDKIEDSTKPKFNYTETEMGNDNEDSKINSSMNNEEDSMFNNLNTSDNQSVKPKPYNGPKPFSGTFQLDKMLKINNIKLDQNESSNIMDSSSFFQNSQSMIYNNQSEIDEYVDDDDLGFELYECDREYMEDTSKKLSEQYGFPERAVYKSKYKDLIRDKDREKKDDKEIKSNLPKDAKFMKSNDPYYPIVNNNVCLDCFDMKMIINREKIGFEAEKEISMKPNMLIAGRYKFIKELGDAAFSTAVQCYDILEKRMICIKIIKNNKDYFDQSIDEIKLLRYINANGDPDDMNFLRIYDYFYYKEHLMIVSELLKDNLYDFYKYINDNNVEYFTIPRIQKITKQLLICLEFIHKLRIIHCDLKPENILMKSIKDATCKIIDFGSSCFIHDHLSTYIQSRSYRAPEVIIGCKYDYKIDMWSLGCILAEIYTGNVLFQNDSIQSMLARIIGICGPFPDWMFEKGKLANDFFTKEKLLYMEPNENNSSLNQSIHINTGKSKKIHILVPKRSSLRKRLRTSDDNFYSFVKKCLEIDPNQRMSATEALNHPWIKDVKYPENEEK